MCIRDRCKDIHYSIGEKKILNGVSLKVEGEQFQTILGPNGSGKSTLLKTIYRQLKPDSGQILLDGKSLDQVSLKETAKEMAVVTPVSYTHLDGKGTADYLIVDSYGYSGSAMILYHFTIHKGQPVVLVSMQNQGNPENMYYMYPTNNKDIQEAFANIVNDK